MNAITQQIFGKRLLEVITPEDYMSWAISMLQQGYASPSLNILAGLTHKNLWATFDQYFFLSIQELDIASPFPWKLQKEASPNCLAKLHVQVSYDFLVTFIGIARFEEACREALADSVRPDYGRGSANFDSDVPLDLFELIWLSDDTVQHKLDLVFQLYQEMPCYSFIQSISLNFEDLSQGDRQYFWTWIRSMLASEHLSYPNPVAYGVWCNFFENAERVEEAWRQLTHARTSDRILAKVLEISGPVPFRLKSELYERLLPQASFHIRIFRSLLHSAFDYYGDLDNEKGRKFLSELQLEPMPENYDRLLKKLGDHLAC